MHVARRWARETLPLPIALAQVPPGRYLRKNSRRKSPAPGHVPTPGGPVPSCRSRYSKTLRRELGPLADTQTPPQADRVLISVNPLAGACSAHERAMHLAALLGDAGLAVEIHTDLAEVCARAAECHARGGLRALVAVGGDGTVSELANRTPPGLPIAVLPAGTENLLARHFQLPERPEAVARVIRQGERLSVDAGRAGDRIFLVMLSCGFDAAVVHHFHGRRTGHIRKLGYLSSIAGCVARYSFPEIRVYWDEEDPSGSTALRRELAARWLFVFNLPRYGGGFRIAPQADPGDGLLDACTFRGGGLWHGLRFAAMVYLGRHQQSADWTMFRARRLRITASGPVPCQADGDPAGTLPLDVEVLPGRLTLMVDNQTAGKPAR